MGCCTSNCQCILEKIMGILRIFIETAQYFFLPCTMYCMWHSNTKQVICIAVWKQNQWFHSQDLFSCFTRAPYTKSTKPHCCYNGSYSKSCQHLPQNCLKKLSIGKKKKRLNIVMPPLLYVSKPFLPSDVNLIFYLSGDGIFKQLDCAHSTFFFSVM